MATDAKPNQPDDHDAKAQDASSAPKPLKPDPVETPPASHPEPSPHDQSGGQADAKARFEQGQPAYKQRQERVRGFGVEGLSDRYRDLPAKEPALHIDRFLLQEISKGLLRGRIVILECIEPRLLQDVRL